MRHPSMRHPSMRHPSMRHPSMRHPAWRTRLALVTLIPLVALCLLMPLISGCSLAPVRTTLPPVPGAPSGDLTQTCSNGKCLSYTTWGQNIEAAINGKAVGYAYVILHNGSKTQATNSFGQARTVADPPATAMTTSAPFNVASVTKTLTAAAVLHLLAAQHISVNSSIAPYLPPSWPLGHNVNAITFAQLLTHTSGLQLPPGGNGGVSYTDLKALMGQNIDLGPTGYKASCLRAYSQGQFAKCYQNANFSLFRILIPYLLGSANADPPAHVQGDASLDEATAQDYLSYMKSVYGSSVPISCTPQGSAGSRMLSYRYPGAGAGTDWGDWLHTCGAIGLQLSADDMAAFLAHLTSGDYLPLIASSDPDTPTFPAMVTNMYGWDYQFPNAKYGVCVAKNGDLGQTDAHNVFVPYVTTLIVYCPKTGLAFAGLANSRLGSAQSATHGFTGSWDDIVINAYNASWR
jgi:CubicO group peptidase (beta-lactamase class C family)